MTILFCVISRSTSILVEHAVCAGNFNEIVEQVLAKISSQNHKHTYTHSSYNFHYICENGIVYLCISDNKTDQSTAFSFLEEIKKRFLQQYGSSISSALPYSFSSDFAQTLTTQMKQYNREGLGGNRMRDLNSQVSDIKNIMTQNIEALVDRGEKLDLLVNKTEELSNSSVSFRVSATSVKRKMWWKNIKIIIIIIIVSIIALYLVISMFCGGLSWSHCISHSNNSTNI